MYHDKLLGSAPNNGAAADMCRTAEARLRALAEYQVLDTPEEADFDDLAQLAADVFDAPIAAITLIDADRQWLKAKIGIEPRETPLDVSICRYGLTRNEVLVVTDALQDDRFCTNPFVAADGGLRFYAGAPLVTPQGTAIGMICVLDVKPREAISERQRRMLITLASQVIAQLELRRECREREKLSEAARAGEARFRKILDSLPQVTWSAPATGGIDYVSSQWADVYGTEQASLLGRGWLEAVHPDDKERVLASWMSSLESGKPYQETFRVRLNTGEHRWTLSRASPQRGEDGSIDRWYGTCVDVHDETIVRHSLARREALQRSFLDASPDGIQLLKLDGTIEMMNAQGFAALGHLSEDAVKGKDWVGTWPEAARATVAAALEAALQGEIASFQASLEATQKGKRWWDCRISPVRNEAGDVIRLLAISRDVTSSHEAADKLRWTSQHDGLTTLPNREAFQTHLQAATLRAMESDGMVGLLLMDLDHFKHVNDTLGHAAGDHLLKTFGERLKVSVRGSDFVARLGGDEFAVILEGIKGQTDLLKAGQGILTRLQAPIRYGDRVLSAGASIGGALFPNDAASAHELFKNADTALYALKNSGRGGTRMFHNYMREEAQKVASQLSLARTAITEESVIPHYQQKIELKTGRIQGFEALLRWNHPIRGIQPPDAVAEAFKDYELAAKIGELMQTKVFADIRSWQRAGIKFGRVSINAAPAEFLRDDYAERLLNRLEQHQVPGELVEIEVTEHVFLERGSEYVSRALKLLNESGVRISLDDFGTGYSSLSHLRDFPVDVVKIDGSFISKMNDDPEIRAIVSAVIDLAASLSIQVVAEGIETEEQEALLRNQGCALGQGYLFGRAVIADEVRILLER